MSEKCIISGCPRARAMRGLCLKCYSCAKKTVEANKATWGQLETLGLALPDSEPFDAAFNKAVTEIARGTRSTDASTRPGD